jgi:N-alpha-acetyltransferase 15/16, NatA auxiliary subunit
MQCMWLTLEEGDSYLRQGQKGKALKRYHTVEKFFSDIFDDQFDFHTYCLRKTTLRSYVEYVYPLTTLSRFVSDSLMNNLIVLFVSKTTLKATTTLSERPLEQSRYGKTITNLHSTGARKEKLKCELDWFSGIYFSCRQAKRSQWYGRSNYV